MNESNIVRVENESSQMASVQEIKSQDNAIHQILKTVMKEGEHYGKIPGCGEKMALLKPGAEKIASAFRLAIRPEITMREYQFHREYEVRCIVTHAPSGTFIGEGIGSCSTMEAKYMYRSENTGREVPSSYWKTRDKNELGGDEFDAKKVQGKWMIMHREKHGNPPDFWNTALKMAKKRALVDAILTVTACSDIFSQEEDTDGYGDDPERAPVVEAPPMRQPQPMAPNPTGIDFISEPQRKRLFALTREHGKSDEAVKEYLNGLGFMSSQQIPKSYYQQVCDWVCS